MKTRTSIARFALGLLALLAGVPCAVAADLHVVVSGGLAPAYRELAPRFERSSGHHLITEAGSSLGSTATAIPMRLDRGESIDVVLMVKDGIAPLIGKHQLDAASVTDLARSKIAMAVRDGAPVPDIRTVAALRRTLLAARSVAWSDSASGVYLRNELFPRLGIAKEMAAKGRTIQATPVGEAVASGEFELGFQQYSELLAVRGIHIVGTIPDEVQKVTMYSAAVATRAQSPAAAHELLRFLASPEARSALQESGLDPVNTGPR